MVTRANNATWNSPKSQTCNSDAYAPLDIQEVFFKNCNTPIELLRHKDVTSAMAAREGEEEGGREEEGRERG